VSMDGRARRMRAAVPGCAVLGVVLTLLVLVRLTVSRSLDGTLRFEWPAGDIQTLRITAILVAVSAGAALSLSGLHLQSMLRNPLASPFILGVSGGAALGVMLSLYAGYRLGFDPAVLDGSLMPAFAGAMTVLMIVFLLGRTRGWPDPLAMLLTGVVIASICGGGIMLLQHLVPQGLRGDLVTWMSGSIRPGTSPALTAVLLVIAAAGLCATLLLARSLDALALSDEEARSIGVRVGPVRAACFLLAGLLAASTVAMCGPIGFVGLVGPHVARLLVGPQHRAAAVAAVLAGAAMLVTADVASTLIPSGVGRIPAGVFTALIGGPVFIWLLRRDRAAGAPR